MTTPFGSTPGDREDDGLPRYEPTTHPEDREDFGRHASGATSDTPGYGGYAGYGAEDAALPGYAGANNQYGASGPAYTGPVSAIEAIKWGFRAAAKNPALWILGAIAVFVIQAALQFIPAVITGFNADPQAEASPVSIAFSLVSAIVSAIIAILTMRLIFFQIDDPKTSWSYVGKDVRWGPVIVTSIVTGLITVAITAALFGIFFLLSGGANAFDTFSDPTTVPEAEAIAQFGKMMLLVIVASLASVLLSPFWFFMVWLAADGETIGRSISRGFALGRKNYLQVLLFNVLDFLLVLASIITLGLALVFIVPAMYLANGHLTRQAAGGYAPAAS